MRRLVLVALLAACGGDDGNSGPIPIGELDEALENTMCNVYVKCGLIDDLATCRAIISNVGFDADTLAAVENGSVMYNAELAGACLSALGGAGCSSVALDRAGDDLGCEGIFSGTVAAGGACAIDEQCVSQQCNTTACPDACCPGTCADGPAPTQPRVGESCADNPTCIGSFCDGTTAICTEYRANGQACTDDDECVSGSCESLFCATPPGPGEGCNPEYSCSHMGYICNPGSLTCEPYGLSGDTCAAQTDPCSPLYVCGTAGTCQLRPRLGEACSPQTGGCIDNSWCDSTTMQCTAPKADGAVCNSSQECASDNCDFDTGMCAAEPVCV